MIKDRTSTVGSRAHGTITDVRTRTAVWDRIRRDYIAILGTCLLSAVIVAAIIAPFLRTLDPVRTDVAVRLSGPSVKYPLGTDQLGRDVLSRVIFGARVSIAVALGSVVLAALVGVTVGIASGFSGGLLDEIMMRGMDFMFAFPAILMALTIVTVLGHSSANLVVALGIVYAPRFARIARASTLATKVETYVEAARSLGASPFRIIHRHILPNSLSPLLIVTTITLASAVLAEASLSFLGLGVQPPYPSWGRMLSEGKAYLEIASWLTVFPGLAVVATVLSFNLIGDSLRDALDPRIRF